MFEITVDDKKETMEIKHNNSVFKIDLTYLFDDLDFYEKRLNEKELEEFRTLLAKVLKEEDL